MSAHSTVLRAVRVVCVPKGPAALWTVCTGTYRYVPTNGAYILSTALVQLVLRYIQVLSTVPVRLNSRFVQPQISIPVIPDMPTLSQAQVKLLAGEELTSEAQPWVPKASCRRSWDGVITKEAPALPVPEGSVKINARIEPTSLGHSLMSFDRKAG